MRLIEVSAVSVLKISNQELLNMHLRTHQLWALYKKGMKFNPQLLITKHQILVNEMIRRKMNHNRMSDLDDAVRESLYNALDNAIQIIQESAPKNPDTIIIKNKYYPHGLSEKRIYEYYMGKKNDILKYISNRTVSFFLSIDNKIVVKRLHKGQRIILTPDNFEEMITGRTISIHINRSSETTNYVVIDIDPGKQPSSDLAKSWKTAALIMKNNFKDIVHMESLFTGNGIHLIIYFKKIYHLDRLRNLVIEALNNGQDKYLVNQKGSSNINYDMSPNYIGNMHISKFSLNENGLMVDDVQRVGVLSPEYYKI